MLSAPGCNSSGTLLTLATTAPRHEWIRRRRKWTPRTAATSRGSLSERHPVQRLVRRDERREVEVHEVLVLGLKPEVPPELGIPRLHLGVRADELLACRVPLVQRAFDEIHELHKLFGSLGERVSRHGCSRYHRRRRGLRWQQRRR